MSECVCVCVCVCRRLCMCVCHASTTISAFILYNIFVYVFASFQLCFPLFNYLRLTSYLSLSLSLSLSLFHHTIYSLSLYVVPRSLTLPFNQTHQSQCLVQDERFKDIDCSIFTSPKPMTMALSTLVIIEMLNSLNR